MLVISARVGWLAQLTLRALHQNEGLFRVLESWTVFLRATVSDESQCLCAVCSISMVPFWPDPFVFPFFCMSQKSQRHARPVRKRVLNACCVFYALTKKETCNWNFITWIMEFTE